MIRRSSSAEFSIQQAEASWNLLEKAIDIIYEKKSSTLSYEELYRNAYYLVLYRYGDVTYKNLQKKLEKTFEKYSQEVVNLQEEALLEGIVVLWEDIKLMLKMVKHIFLYLDKNHVIPNKLKPVIIMGYNLFNSIFLDPKSKFGKKIIQSILNMIENERKQQKINRTLIKNILLMIVTIRFLLNIFFFYFFKI